MPVHCPHALPPSSLGSISTQTRRELILDRLRAAISSGELRPAPIWPRSS